MQTKKKNQPQQKQRPDNKDNNTGNNKLNRGTQQPGSQTEVHQQEDAEEKSFERDPGQQKNPKQGNKAVVNEQEQQDELIEGDDMFEE